MPPGVPARAGAAPDAMDGVVPRHVVEPDSAEGFAAALAEASRERQQTVIRGGRSKLGWGRPPAAVDIAIGTARLNRLLAHRHGDLTATVQSGIRLRDLNDALRSRGQWLPVESAFADATAGGIVATNDSGPSRHRNGTPRDLVIGVTLALTDGRLVKAGGTVVKNVAGYDLGKLVSGSHGTLAGIADLTFKLVPIPAASATLIATYADASAMARDVAALAASQVEPAAFDVAIDGDATASPGPYRLMLRVATSPAATDAQIASARALVSGESIVAAGDDERAMWDSHVAAPWSGDAVVRVSWLPARLPQVIALIDGLHRAAGVRTTLIGRAAGTGLLRLMGDAPAQATAVTRLRASADVGNVVVLKASRELKGLVDVWGAPRDSDPVLTSLKQMFDPAGVLNAGRGPV